MQLTTRNAELSDLAALLRDQHGRKLDMIVPASAITSENATLRVKGAEPVIDDSGVTTSDGLYVPTVVCDEHVAARLSIPVTYLKKLRTERPDIYDANVNGWLSGHATTPGVESENPYKPDPRSFMLRTFKGDDTDRGVARALLSDRYSIVDNLDVLMQTLEGVKEAGVNVEIDSCDLSERRMFVSIIAPEVTALAPVLLKNYRSPFDSPDVERAVATTAPTGYWNQARADRFAQMGERYGWDGSMPLVFAGFKIGNSETGGGAFSIAPEIRVLSCWNGITITHDVLRKVHVGGKLDEGVIKWSDDTQRKSLDLIKAQTRDAVSTFLDVEYVKSVIEQIEQKADSPIVKPDATIRSIGKSLAFTENEIDGVLDHFIRGGQMTAGGVLNAVTSFSQTIVDVDAAHELSANAMRAFEMAAAN